MPSVGSLASAPSGHSDVSAESVGPRSPPVASPSKKEGASAASNAGLTDTNAEAASSIEKAAPAPFPAPLPSASSSQAPAARAASEEPEKMATLTSELEKLHAHAQPHVSNLQSHRPVASSAPPSAPSSASISADRSTGVFAGSSAAVPPKADGHSSKSGTEAAPAAAQQQPTGPSAIQCELEAAKNVPADQAYKPTSAREPMGSQDTDQASAADPIAAAKADSTEVTSTHHPCPCKLLVMLVSSKCRLMPMHIPRAAAHDWACCDMQADGR